MLSAPQDIYGIQVSIHKYYLFILIILLIILLKGQFVTFLTIVPWLFLFYSLIGLL